MRRCANREGQGGAVDGRQARVALSPDERGTVRGRSGRSRRSGETAGACEMRVDFVKAVNDVLASDEASVFITGDVGYAALETLRATYGARFLNAGVAEQNMMGVAAGMAFTGLRPWVYSIAPFVTYRCLEQIRNDVCLHRLPVRIAGNGGGFTYGIMAATHHALEDLAVLRPLPNMELFFPCSNDHVAIAVAKMAALPGPAYIRLAISPYTTPFMPLSENLTTLTRHYS